MVGSSFLLTILQVAKKNPLVVRELCDVSHLYPIHPILQDDEGIPPRMFWMTSAHPIFKEHPLWHLAKGVYWCVSACIGVFGVVDVDVDVSNG